MKLNLVAYELLVRYTSENEGKCCPQYVFCTRGVGGEREEKESPHRFFLDLNEKGSTTKWLNKITV